MPQVEQLDLECAHDERYFPEVLSLKIIEGTATKEERIAFVKRTKQIKHLLDMAECELNFGK